MLVRHGGAPDWHYCASACRPPPLIATPRSAPQPAAIPSPFDPLPCACPLLQALQAISRKSACHHQASVVCAVADCSASTHFAVLTAASHHMLAATTAPCCRALPIPPVPAPPPSCPATAEATLTLACVTQSLNPSSGCSGGWGRARCTPPACMAPAALKGGSDIACMSNFRNPAAPYCLEDAATACAPLWQSVACAPVKSGSTHLAVLTAPHATTH